MWPIIVDNLWSKYVLLSFWNWWVRRQSFRIRTVVRLRRTSTRGQLCNRRGRRRINLFKSSRWVVINIEWRCRSPRRSGRLWWHSWKTDGDLWWVGKTFHLQDPAWYTRLQVLQRELWGFRVYIVMKLNRTRASVVFLVVAVLTVIPSSKAFSVFMRRSMNNTGRVIASCIMQECVLCTPGSSINRFFVRRIVPGESHLLSLVTF